MFRSLISVVINLVSKSEISTELEIFKNFQFFFTFFFAKNSIYVLLIRFNYDLFVYFNLPNVRSHESFEAKLKTDRRLYKWGGLT